jgi:hypothetical protein
MGLVKKSEYLKRTQLLGLVCKLMGYGSRPAVRCGQIDTPRTVGLSGVEARRPSNERADGDVCRSRHRRFERSREPRLVAERRTGRQGRGPRTLSVILSEVQGCPLMVPHPKGAIVLGQETKTHPKGWATIHRQLERSPTKR